MLSVSPTTGSTVGILYGPSGGQRPGRDLAWTEDGWVKLTQTDGFVLLDRSMLLTHYSPNGTYQSQGAWGTAFEDDPAHVTQGADGALWVAEAPADSREARGTPASCGLDSIGPLGSWASDMMGLGVYNDPLFDEVTSVSDATLHHTVGAAAPTLPQNAQNFDCPPAWTMPWLETCAGRCWTPVAGRCAKAKAQRSTSLVVPRACTSFGWNTKGRTSTCRCWWKAASDVAPCAPLCTIFAP